jgi:hypothetical protein
MVGNPVAQIVDSRRAEPGALDAATGLANAGIWALACPPVKEAAYGDDDEQEGGCLFGDRQGSCHCA